MGSGCSTGLGCDGENGSMVLETPERLPAHQQVQLRNSGHHVPATITPVLAQIRADPSQVAPHHRNELTQMGFEWDPAAAEWNSVFLPALRAHFAQSGTLHNAPAAYDENGVSVAQVVEYARANPELVPERAAIELRNMGAFTPRWGPGCMNGLRGFYQAHGELPA